jgi:hypothetical protein
MDAPTVIFETPCNDHARGYVPGTYVTHTVEVLGDGSVLVQEWFVDNLRQQVRELGSEFRVVFTLNRRSPSRAWQRRRDHYWTATMTNSHRTLRVTDGKETRGERSPLPFFMQVEKSYRGGTHLAYMGGIESDSLKAALTAYLGKPAGRWGSQHPELPWVK